MAADPPQDWSREFKELGADRVRSGLVSGKWDRAKRTAARVWIETADARAWQEKRGGEGADSVSFILGLRNAKWWRYVGPALMVLGGIGLLLRRLH
jgi:hypothetical protein